MVPVVPTLHVLYVANPLRTTSTSECASIFVSPLLGVTVCFVEHRRPVRCPASRAAGRASGTTWAEERRASRMPGHRFGIPNEHADEASDVTDAPGQRRARIVFASKTMLQRSHPHSLDLRRTRAPLIKGALSSDLNNFSFLFCLFQ